MCVTVSREWLGAAMSCSDLRDLDFDALVRQVVEYGPWWVIEAKAIAGDTFPITIEDGMVGYQKNGTTLHTSAPTATGAMRISYRQHRQQTERSLHIQSVRRRSWRLFL